MADIVDVLRQAMALRPEEQAEIVARLSSRLARGQVSQVPMSLSVRQDDITNIPCDAVVTGVLPSGEWGVKPSQGNPWIWSVVNPRSIDAAICGVAGGQYHLQALTLVGAPEGTTLLAGRQWIHRGAFDSVLFAVDNWQIPMPELATAILRAADDAGLTSLAMPLMRTGAGSGHGGTPVEKVGELVGVLRSYAAQGLRRVHLVAEDPAMVELARQALQAGQPSLKVMLGDITRVDSDALILGINSEGVWAGGVDRAIYSSSGQQFHNQAQALIDQPDETVVVARTLEPHNGAFRNVIFVADNLKAPLYDILQAGLRAADREGFTSVTLPAVRMGVMMMAGGPPEEKVRDMALAVKDFASEARSVREITFVIYGDPVTFETLRQALGMEPTQG